MNSCLYVCMRRYCMHVCTHVIYMYIYRYIDIYSSMHVFTCVCVCVCVCACVCISRGVQTRIFDRAEEYQVRPPTHIPLYPTRFCFHQRHRLVQGMCSIIYSLLPRPLFFVMLGNIFTFKLILKKFYLLIETFYYL